MQERQKAYCHVLGMMASEDKSSDHAFKMLRKFQGLNPKSLVEAAMQCKTDKELHELARKTEESERAFQVGYEKGLLETGGLPLPQSIKTDLQRRYAYVKSGIPPKQREDAIVELVAQIMKLLDRGYKI